MQFRRNAKQQHSSRAQPSGENMSNPNMPQNEPRHAHQMVIALRNRVAELEMLHAADQLRKSTFFAVCSATSSLYSSDDLPKLLRAVYSALSSLNYAFDSYHVSLINPDGQPALTVHHIKKDQNSGQIIIKTEHCEEYAQAPQLAAWRGQEAMYFPDMGGKHPISLFAAETVSDIRSAIDLPFEQGTLTICSKKVNAFGAPSLESSLETLNILSHGLSVGLYRIRDLLEIEQANDGIDRHIAKTSEETILQLGGQRLRNMAMRMEIDADWLCVVQGCQQELKRVAYFERLVIHFTDEECSSLFAFAVDEEGHVVEIEPFTATPLVQELLKQNQPLLHSARAQLVESGCDAFHTLSTQSSIDVPFASGVLSISSSTMNAFSERDVSTVAYFASVIHEAHRRLQDITLLQERQKMLLQAQKMESIGQLTTGIAHNFNNMLQVILGNLHMSKAETNFTARQLMLDSAYDAAQRSAEIVRQLMVTVRPQSNEIAEPIDVASSIRHIVDFACRTFDRSIEITLTIADDLPPVEIDGDQFEQVVLNLLINARDAVAELEDRSPHIAIEASKRPDSEDGSPSNCICIRITDNGIGMDTSTKKRALEPFFTTKSIDVATGLGLSMVDSIIQQRGGAIEVQSQLGQGSTFSVFLPTMLHSVPTPIMKTILVVEDEESVRLSLVAILQHSGYYVVSATNGREGLEAFHRMVPDLVMLDLSMPEMSGRELLSEIRQVNEDAKVLICTGLDTQEDDFGEGTLVLNKPFIVADLFKSIEQMLQTANGKDA